MKQSNSKAKIYYATDTQLRFSKKDRDKTAFIYVRISREDDLEAESYSIQNQIKLLTQLAKEYGYSVVVVFMDDAVIMRPTRKNPAVRAFSPVWSHYFSAPNGQIQEKEGRIQKSDKLSIGLAT